MTKKIDEVAFLARWLYVAADEAGQVELVRGLIRDAMTASVEMYGLPEENEPDDPEEIPNIIGGRFASEWDECDREGSSGKND
jgi:hypothetical protein